MEELPDDDRIGAALSIGTSCKEGAENCWAIGPSSEIFSSLWVLVIFVLWWASVWNGQSKAWQSKQQVDASPGFSSHSLQGYAGCPVEADIRLSTNYRGTGACENINSAKLRRNYVLQVYRELRAEAIQANVFVRRVSFVGWRFCCWVAFHPRSDLLDMAQKVKIHYWLIDARASLAIAVCEFGNIP